MTITGTLSCARSCHSKNSILSVQNNISHETVKSFLKFLEPSQAPKVVYTDNPIEFGKACEVLSWNHRTSTPHRSETHGIADRAVPRVKEVTSTVLLQSGLDGRWWSDGHGRLWPNRLWPIRLWPNRLWPNRFRLVFVCVCVCLCVCVCVFVCVGFTVSVWGFQGFGLVMFGAPGTAVPGTALPGTALPGTALPGTALPGTALPGTALRRTAQNFALFFPSPAAKFVLFFPLWVYSR